MLTSYRTDICFVSLCSVGNGKTFQFDLLDQLRHKISLKPLKEQPLLSFFFRVIPRPPKKYGSRLYDFIVRTTDDQLKRC